MKAFEVNGAAWRGVAGKVKNGSFAFWYISNEFIWEQLHIGASLYCTKSGLMNQMTKEQVKLVKQTWRMLRNVSPAVVGDLFYSKLFIDNPRVKKMFPSDLQQQYVKLFDMITAIVSRLDDLEELSDSIRAMAQRHAGYGVKAAHYPPVGAALLWTLEKGLGNSWNEEVKDAWTACYTMLAETMIKAAAESPVS